MMYPKDRSLDSGLSCPDDDTDIGDDTECLPMLQDHTLMASCPDFTAQQRFVKLLQLCP